MAWNLEVERERFLPAVQQLDAQSREVNRADPRFQIPNFRVGAHGNGDTQIS
jgi:hypothetical protein